MLVIGLTGGIGSGKSTVASLFAERGIAIIDADSIAKALTESDQPAFSTIVSHFKENVLSHHGKLNRAKLREIIFNHPDERHWLEKLLHPLIEKELKQQIKQIASPYCIAVIPLLIEVESYSFINRILIVDTKEYLQVERTMLRDKAEKNIIETIIQTQASREKRLAKAHDIIVNDGLLADLIPQVEKLHQFYLKIASKES